MNCKCILLFYFVLLSALYDNRVPHTDMIHFDILERSL